MSGATLELGTVYLTAGVNSLVHGNKEFSKHIETSLTRYCAQDWGDLPDDDREMNDVAVNSGENRVLAAYKHPAHEDWRIWIITEWDRSATTILFPAEY